MWFRLAAYSVLFAVLFGCAAAVRNKDVNRELDLSTQFEVHRLKIEVHNDGSSPLAAYTLPLEADLAPHLAYAEARSEGTSLRVAEPAQAKEGTVVVVSLAKPLAAGASTVLTVQLKFTHRLRPFPQHIGQLDPQFVKYSGNPYLYSAYPSDSQRTLVKLSSKNVDSYSEQPAPVEKKDEQITYGPYADVPPLQRASIELHFENNRPFITVTKLIRELEISHWGANLAVEEHYWVEHSGAALQGSWSRADYFQRNMRAPESNPSVRSLKLLLPPHAADVYYRDDIGNISTSHVFASDDASPVDLELLPRFPLFGGWKTNFYIGYNLPLSEFLSRSGSKYRLTAPFSIHLSDAVIDELELRVILSEGATDISAKFPFSVQQIPGYVHKTFLDTTGRPVHSVTKRNVVAEQSRAQFTLEYAYAASHLLHEPALLIGSWLALFLFVMFWVRLDLSISPKSHVSS